MWKEYLTPSTIAEAMAALTAADGTARVIAGGTDISLQSQGGDVAADTAVDITAIPGMGEIALDGHDLVLGACVTHAQAAASPLVWAYAPVLAAACATVGSPQIRNAGTIGGNIVNAQPAADAAIALLALDATAVIVGREGERREPLASLFAGPGRSTVDATSEILTGVRLRALREGEGSAFARLARRRALALPMLNAAAVVKVGAESDGQRIQWARIALGPVAPTPFRAVRAEATLRGAPRTPEVLDRAAETAADEAQPRSSLLRGNHEYRKRMVRVLVRRALSEALGLG